MVDRLLRRPLRRFAAWLATVTAIDVGKKDDGLAPMSAGTPLDKSWYDLQQEFTDSLEAWRKNPLARRLVSIVTAFVLGSDGIRLRSDYGPLDRFLTEFMNHPKNQVALKQTLWSDELTRSGELFPVLFTNEADGMSYIRMMPASQIEHIVTADGDYETELEYQEVSQPGEDPKIWYSPHAPRSTPNGSVPPVMLHYAINRPVGCVRGESDLAPILPWLKRYSRWLEDRVRLNSAIRAFLWIVKVPGKLVQQKQEQYKSPPSPGSVIIADREGEEWEAVTPSLQARDAAADGRMIRWMIVAGGPGTGLTDIGEAETANLATAKAMGELRRRFLRQRQAYFAFIIQDIALTAWNRAVEAGLRRGKPATLQQIHVTSPDVSPEDNEDLARAATAISTAMTMLNQTMAPSEELRRLTLNLVLKFAGESLPEDRFDAIVTPQPFQSTPSESLTIHTNGHQEQLHA